MDQEIIEPTNKSHRILFTVLTVLLTAGVIGGSVYYVLGKQVKEQNNKIAELEKTVADSKKVGTKTGAVVATSAIFDVTTANVGDKAGEMTIVSIKPFSMTLEKPKNEKISAENAKISFSGEATISGEYEYSYSDYDGSYMLYFKPDSNAKNLPLMKDDEYGNNMIFTNKEEAFKLLGITSQNEKKGKVNITIRDYEINRYSAAVPDSAKLISVKF